MKQEHKNWIDNYTGDIHRQCVEVSNEMKAVFPELRIAKGLVTIFENGKDYPHMWLVDAENNIVDPTKQQLMDILEDKEIKDSDPQPVGKCMNCGEYVFERFYMSAFCGDKCYKEYIEYYGEI